MVVARPDTTPALGRGEELPLDQLRRQLPDRKRADALDPPARVSLILVAPWRVGVAIGLDEIADGHSAYP